MFQIKKVEISTFFYLKLRNSEIQNLKILRFLISEILNFYNSCAALGIGAASFAKRSGKWDSGTGIGEFGDIFERGKISEQR
ncbi:MAG: hypothetical protein IKV80_06680 [Bacteroidales bacterium]|nr:hypothetical protein [Bacteroidales bacterium]